jgi:hypothetical protein
MKVEHYSAPQVPSYPYLARSSITGSLYLVFSETKHMCLNPDTGLTGVIRNVGIQNMLPLRHGEVVTLTQE